ncbi:hypothetical protein [Streptomyces abyssomicinicus]|uniref:hypothetical protein n=1 Tax=Streptomyces abyssomicinicus TaxID=574929 RepID=UPI00124FBD29|nr:hypothetical protein [Streptomyces abyssomicinicus]
MRQHARQAAEPVVVTPSAIVQPTRPQIVAEARAEATVIPLDVQPEEVYVPGVGRVLAYVPQHGAPAQPATARTAEPLPTWVRATALLMPAGALSVAVTAWGLSYAVAALEAIVAGIWALAATVAVVGLVVGGVAVACRSGRRGSGSVTATATATSRGGLFSKATATATATVKR